MKTSSLLALTVSRIYTFLNFMSNLIQNEIKNYLKYFYSFEKLPFLELIDFSYIYTDVCKMVCS